MKTKEFTEMTREEQKEDICKDLIKRAEDFAMTTRIFLSKVKMEEGDAEAEAISDKIKDTFLTEVDKYKTMTIGEIAKDSLMMLLKELDAENFAEMMKEVLGAIE